MKRPLAYVTAAWRGGECEVMEQAAKYCRIVYDAGYSPICPMLYLPLFLNDAVPEEHKSGIDMGARPAPALPRAGGMRELCQCSGEK